MGTPLSLLSLSLLGGRTLEAAEAEVRLLPVYALFSQLSGPQASDSSACPAVGNPVAFSTCNAYRITKILHDTAALPCF